MNRGKYERDEDWKDAVDVKFETIKRQLHKAEDTLEYLEREVKKLKRRLGNKKRT